MTESISFDGVEKLRKMKPLPKNWETLIDKYISIKRFMVSVYRKRGIDTSDNEVMILKAIEIRDEIKLDVKYGLRLVKHG